VISIQKGRLRPKSTVRYEIRRGVAVELFTLVRHSVGCEESSIASPNGSSTGYHKEKDRAWLANTSGSNSPQLSFQELGSTKGIAADADLVNGQEESPPFAAQICHFGKKFRYIVTGFGGPLRFFYHSRLTVSRLRKILDWT
jgi:hypothetical protein